VGSFITLTTDFGQADSYVAAMKAVIYSLNPEATIIDISHIIQPQNIEQAAFVLSTVYALFPLYTVHTVVVDPGVGTQRKAIILKTPRASFVAPDNGVLSYVLEDLGAQQVPGSPRVTVTGDSRAYAITRSEYWRKPVSATFHGRDILAPVAAQLSLGRMASSLGDSIDTLAVFPITHPVRREDGLTGHIRHIDGFGNLITDIRAIDLPGPGNEISIEYQGRVIHGLVAAYAGPTAPDSPAAIGQAGPVALIGSHGLLEIAVPNSRAADFFQASTGDEVKINLSL
jgi:S-adenosyl-L-methionine hydrolase (adenosine-forming)